MESEGLKDHQGQLRVVGSDDAELGSSGGLVVVLLLILRRGKGIDVVVDIRVREGGKRMKSERRLMVGGQWNSGCPAIVRVRTVALDSSQLLCWSRGHLCRSLLWRFCYGFPRRRGFLAGVEVVMVVGLYFVG